MKESTEYAVLSGKIVLSAERREDSWQLKKTQLAVDVALQILTGYSPTLPYALSDFVALRTLSASTFLKPLSSVRNTCGDCRDKQQAACNASGVFNPK